MRNDHHRKLRDRSPWRVLALLAVLALCSTRALAQQPLFVTINDVDTSRFPDVTAYVTVSDDRGRAVFPLASEAFAAAEEGLPVTRLTVEALENVGAPILLALALDTSGSMQGQPLKETQNAAERWIGELGPADQVALLSFDDGVTTRLALSGDRAAAVTAVRALKAAGGTALYDAVQESVRLLAAHPHGRKAVVVLTDGEDTASKLTDDDAIRAAQEAGIPVYAIGYGPAIRPAVLERLATATGGHFYRAPAPDQIGDSFETVASLLRLQYVLRFRSELAADDAEHSLRVSARVEGAEAAGEATFVAARGKVVVEMVSPAEGATVGGLVTLKPSIAAPGDVLRVEYLLDGLPLATATTGEMAYVWDTAGVALGPHTLTVRATDSAGNQGGKELAVTVAEPIVLKIVAPAGDRPVSGRVPVEAEVSALAGVARVDLAVDGVPAGTVTAPPWVLAWEAASVPTGTHALAVTAYDVAGLSARAERQVWVGLKLGLPDLKAGQEVGGRIWLEPAIDAPGEVQTVEYLLDGTPFTATLAAGVEWDASAVPLGQHTLGVRVSDSAGNTDSAAVPVVFVRPIVVTFVSPAEAERQQLSGQVEVLVEVHAVNALEGVDVALDGTRVASLEVEPYAYTWDTATGATGRHTLAVTATDALGQSATERIETWVAFRGSSYGLWVVLAVLLVCGGLILPLAMRRRRRLLAGAGPPVGTADRPPARGGGGTRPGEPRPKAGRPRAAGWLVVEEGPEPGRGWPLGEGETSLGRSRSANDIVVPSPTASRRHAVIRGGADGCVYYDIEPTNPTVVNGRPLVGSHELVEGDRLQVGEVVLRYTKEEPK